MSREAADVCRRAAEIINERGWVQRKFGNHNGPRCLVGALITANIEMRFVLGELPLVAIDAVSAKLALDLNEPSVRAMSWNDRPTTTQREVEKMLRVVADDLEVAS